MKNKRGTEAIYWVVVAAIAFLILVFMVLFINRGMGGGISDMFKLRDSTVNDLETEKLSCQSLCNQAKTQSYDIVEQWQSSGYCRRSASIDLNGNKEIDRDEGETGLHCWNSTAAYVLCNLELNDGTLIDYCHCTDAECCGDGEINGLEECETDLDCTIAGETCNPPHSIDIHTDCTCCVGC